MSCARIYRVGTPFNGSELPEVDFEQSADTMYLAHLNHAPTKLVRAGHTNWTFSSLGFTPTIAAPTGLNATATSPNTGTDYFPQPATYVVTALNDVTGQESRPSTTASATNDLGLKRNFNTMAWTASTGASRYRIYKADNTGEYGYIGSTASLSFVDANIGPDYAIGPPQGQNPFPGMNDYPSTVSFFEQRLIWARTNNAPNGVFASRSGDYENMDISRPLRASDALSFKLVAGRVNAVNQIVPMDSLLCITSDSIFKITGGPDGFISPTAFNSKRQNGRGGSRLPPLLIDSNAFYQTSVGNVIRAIGYEFQTDSTQSNDMTIFSSHLFRGFDIVSWAYAQEPRSLVWAVRNDGKLLCFTWEREQQVWGWTICETDGLVESVCVVSENDEDRLYLTVRRGGKLLIERMASAKWSAIDDACFLDSAVSYVFDPPATVLNNLGHLEGRTIKAVADGSVVSDLVVTKGKVTLPDAASRVTAGLPYTATITTLPLAIEGKAGWTMAKPQTASKAVVRLVNSRGVKAGPSADKLETLRNRFDEPPGIPNALQNGLKETFLRPDINGGVSVTVQSDEPLPLTVTGIYADPAIAG